MTEALEQIFKYLIRRDTKAAILLFIRNVDVTAVITQAVALIVVGSVRPAAGGAEPGRPLGVIAGASTWLARLTLAIAVSCRETGCGGWLPPAGMVIV